jgi:hypothetical protein
MMSAFAARLPPRLIELILIDLPLCQVGIVQIDRRVEWPIVRSSFDGGAIAVHLDLAQTPAVFSEFFEVDERFGVIGIFPGRSRWASRCSRRPSKPGGRLEASMSTSVRSSSARSAKIRGSSMTSTSANVSTT